MKSIGQDWNNISKHRSESIQFPPVPDTDQSRVLLRLRVYWLEPALLHGLHDNWSVRI